MVCTFGWFNWYRRLSKDYEVLPTALCIHLCRHDSSDVDRSFKVDPSLLGGGENLRLSRSVSVAEQKL